MNPSPLSRPLSPYGPAARWLPWLSPLLLSFFGLYAVLELLGPRAFCIRDETFCFHQALIFRSTGPLAIAWGDGNILKFFQYTAYQMSGRWRAMHLPVLGALVAQGWALYSIGFRLGGRRVAQGALLAALLSATALLQARSLLSFAILPGLLSVAVALILRGGIWAWVGGALFSAGFLDYEATLFALPGLAALLYLEPRLARSSSRRGLAGMLLGLALVLWACRYSLGEWWLQRMSYNLPSRHLSEQHFFGRIFAWFFGGDAQAYLGVTGHGSFATWALPLAVLGLGLQARRRPWLLVWLFGGLVAMLPASAKLEPQRAFHIVLPLSLAAGFGWRWIWWRARWRPWLAWLLLLLPVVGLGWEQRAFEQSMRAGQDLYGRSQAWSRLGHDPAFTGKIDASLMPLGFAWEALVEPPAGTAPWVWVPSDLAQELPAHEVEQRALQDAEGRFTGDLLIALPDQDPLRKDLAVLRQHWSHQARLKSDMVTGYRRLLHDHGIKTSMGRAVLEKFLIEAGIQSDHYGLEDLQHLAQEPFKSPLLYRSMLIPTWPKDLRLSYWLCHLLEKHCGSSSLSDQERQLLSHPWAEIPISPGAPAWPQP